MPLSKVTVRQDCFPESCRRCDAALPKIADRAPLIRQVVDVPKLEPAVLQFDCHHVTCAGCSTVTCGAPPVGTPAGLLGPGVLAVVALLVAECHVSRRKVQALRQHLLGIQVSLGALASRRRS